MNFHPHRHSIGATPSASWVQRQMEPSFEHVSALAAGLHLSLTLRYSSDGMTDWGVWQEWKN